MGRFFSLLGRSSWKCCGGFRALSEEGMRGWKTHRVPPGGINETLPALDWACRMAAGGADSPPVSSLGEWAEVDAAGRNCRIPLRPVVEDYYVVGPPLFLESGRFLVGREEIFRHLEELFRDPLQKVLVVLYGQRRMGKTSILNRVGARLGPHYIPVLVDLQGLLSDPHRPIRSDRDLWQALMREIGRAVGTPPCPEESPEEFLARIAPVRGERFILLILDEFEKLLQRMDERAVSREFLEHLWHLMQRRQELRVLLSGHLTLPERMGRYWEGLMGVVRWVRVSYLGEDAARRLITDPWDGFRLQYPEEAIQQLMRATGCQPMLLQQACSAVIREVNARMEREGYETYPVAHLEEVERALDRLLREEGVGYFDEIWGWLSPPQRAAVQHLAQADRPGLEGWIPWPEVAGVTEEVVRSLEEGEVLEVDGTRCRFRVGLLPRWLACCLPTPMR